MPTPFPKKSCRNFEALSIRPKRLLFKIPSSPDQKPPEQPAGQQSLNPGEREAWLKRLEATLTPKELLALAQDRELRRAGADSVAESSSDARRALIMGNLPPVGKTLSGAPNVPQNTPPNLPPGSPDISQRSPGEAKERIKQPMTGSQALKYLREKEKQDQTLGLPLKTRISNSVQRLRELTIEQAKLGNVVHGGWSEIELGKVKLANGKIVTVKTQVTNRPISIGTKDDNFTVPVDGPTAKLLAEAAGGMLMTLPVMNALEREAIQYGKFIPFLAGPTIAEEILKKDRSAAPDKKLDPKAVERLSEWKKDPDHPPGAMMEWIETVAERNRMRDGHLTDTDYNRLTWGYAKTVLMNPNQQDGGVTEKGIPLRESLCIGGGITDEGLRVQSGTGNPHNKEYLDYSQTVYAMRNISILEIDGKRYEVWTKDLLRGGGRTIATVDKKNTFALPENTYKVFSGRPIDVEQIYPGITLGKAQTVIDREEVTVPTAPSPEAKPASAPAASLPDGAAPAARASASPGSIGTTDGTPSGNMDGSASGEPTLSNSILTSASETSATSPPPALRKAPAVERVTVGAESIPTGVYALMGDSYTEGYMSQIKSGPLQRFNFQKLDLKTFKSQMNSQSTDWMKKNLASLVLSKLTPGSTVVVLGGVNDIFDARLKNDQDIDDAYRHITGNLEAMYDLVHQKNMSVVAVTIPPLWQAFEQRFTDPEERENHQILWERINNFIKNPEGKPNRVVFLDELMVGEDGRSIDPQFGGSLIDHPGPEGYKFMAAQIQNGVRKLQDDQSAPVETVASESEAHDHDLAEHDHSKEFRESKSFTLQKELANQIEAFYSKYPHADFTDAQLPGLLGKKESEVKGYIRYTDPEFDPFANPEADPESPKKSEPIKFLGMTINHRGKSGPGISLLAIPFLRVAEEILARKGIKYTPKDTIGGYAFRNRFYNGQDTGKKSHHAYGLALDIDPGFNGPKDGRGNIPDEVVLAMVEAGFDWGGHWSRDFKHLGNDPMHFQLRFDPRDPNGPGRAIINNSPAGRKAWKIIEPLIQAVEAKKRYNNALSK